MLIFQGNKSTHTTYNSKFQLQQCLARSDFIFSKEVSKHFNKPSFSKNPNFLRFNFQYRNYKLKLDEPKNNKILKKLNKVSTKRMYMNKKN